MKHLVPTLLLLLLTYAHQVYGQAAESAAPLFDGLGTHHHDVTTDVERAQQYFDQGLILAFGFNHREAARSFREAQRLDSTCAMCHWGEALVLGPNINTAMDPANVEPAYEALQRAVKWADTATPVEQAYIRALEARYVASPPEDRSNLDRAYADAMGKVASRFPDDLDAQVLYAEALMDTTPWDYWKEDGTPRAVTDTILTTLRTVLRRAPDHPMANHLYIHAVEAERPQKGLEEAERLADLVPGAGHLVHMPAHIYIRVGDYHKASRANEQAIEADKRYLEQVDARGSYRLGYIPHNYHFLWSTATLEGRSDRAIESARDMAALVDTSLMRERGLTTLQHYWITPLYALVRFGRWNDILDRPEPAADLIYPRAAWHYARGMALTRKGKYDDARRELASLRALTGEPSLKWVTVWDINKSRDILTIAAYALEGELEAAQGNFEASVAALERAVQLEDNLNYNEPPTWHYPMRQSLGAVLLEAGRPSEAAAVYREDLEDFPKNGWSLFGLTEALRRMGRTDKAQDVERRFNEAWRHADVVLTASRF